MSERKLTKQQQMRRLINQASRKKNLMAQIGWEQDNLASSMFPYASRRAARSSQPLSSFLTADQMAEVEAARDNQSQAQAELALMDYVANNPEPDPEPAPFVGGLQEWTTDQPINAPSTFIPGSDVIPEGAPGASPSINQRVDNFLNTGLDPWGRTASYEADDGTMVNRSNVFTPHYETGEALGVMTRNQRRAYDLEAAAAGF
jgi:hypothetical protein